MITLLKKRFLLKGLLLVTPVLLILAYFISEGRFVFTSTTSLSPVYAQSSSDYNWPMFMHDPQHTGVSSVEIANPPQSNWDGTLVSGTQVWKRNFGALDPDLEPAISAHGRAQPIIVDGVLYQGFLDNPLIEGYEGKFYAVDVRTGANFAAWGSNNPFIAGDSITGSAAVSGGVVVFGSWDGKIYALNTSNGTKRWEFNTSQPNLNPPVMGGRIKASPIIVDGVIYVGCLNRYMYAIDLMTGALKWKYKAGGPIEGAAAYADGKIIFITEPGYDEGFPKGKQHAIGAYALNAGDGGLAWKKPISGENARSAYPIVNGNYVLFMTNTPGVEWESTYDAFITRQYCYLANHGPVDPCDGDDTYVSDYGVDQTLRYAAEFFEDYPHHKVTTVLHVDTGQERLFSIPGIGDKPLPFSAWYLGWIQPLVWRGKYFIFAYQNFWLADPVTGQIEWIRDRNDAMPRIEEQFNFTIGGDTLYFLGDNKGLYLKLGANGKANTNPVQMVGNCTGCGHCGSSLNKDVITGHYVARYAPGQGNGCSEWGGVVVPYQGSVYFQTTAWFYRFSGS